MNSSLCNTILKPRSQKWLKVVFSLGNSSIFESWGFPGKASIKKASFFSPKLLNPPSFCVTTYMGHFPQDGENEENVAFFFIFET